MEQKDYVILLGAPKCGTTSLASWLGRQPYAVLAKQKETLFFTDFAERHWRGRGAGFADNQPLSIEAFDAEFAAKPHAGLRIEASTDNLSCFAAVENIARFSKRDDVRKLWLIAILRDPVERIVSEYEHTLRLGWQTGSLLQSLKLEDERAAKEFNPLFRHIERSRYATQIARYREIFGDQLLVLDFHRIGETGQQNRILDWIGHSDQVAHELHHENQRSVTGRPGTVGLLENEWLLNLGRKIFPKRLRPGIRNWISGGNVEKYQVRDEEIEFIRCALADEIQACRESSDVPTENWCTTLLT